MNRVICAKGHFYDGDKYETCPHCETGVEAIQQDSFSVRHNESEEKSRKGFFHRKERGRQGAGSRVENARLEQTLLLQNNLGSGNTLQESGTDVSMHKPEPEGVSQSLGAAFAVSAGVDDIECEPEKADVEKTVGYFFNGKTEPPTGYLICTAGEDYGTGFLLKTGNNTIGRSASMDVVVMDPKVSREKQAFVIYEPLRREFYIRPGEGTGLCYLNQELVLEPTKMKAFDRIQLGDTKLMLIPVCCKEFSWDEIV